MTPQEQVPAGQERARNRRWQQFLRFLVVGVVATAIHYSVLIGCVEFLRWSPVVASGVGFVLGAIANYALNRTFTFQSTAAHGGAILRFAVVALTGLGWNVLLMHLLSVVLAYPYLLAQVVTTIVVLIWNFFGNALWSFADPKAGKADN